MPVSLLIFTVLFALLYLGLMAFVIMLIVPIFTGAPFAPTSRRIVPVMMALAQVKPGDRVYDLGSGDGRLVVAAAEKGAHAVGYEINPWLVWRARRKIRARGLEAHARIVCGNYWHTRFNDADTIFLFLITNKMAAMERKLQRELKPEARVVSWAFKFPTWGPAEKRDGVYCYVQR